MTSIFRKLFGWKLKRIPGPWTRTANHPCMWIVWFPLKGMVPAAESLNEAAISRCIVVEKTSMSIKQGIVQFQKIIKKQYFLPTTKRNHVPAAFTIYQAKERFRTLEEKKGRTASIIVRFRRCELEAARLPCFQPERFSQPCCRWHNCAFLSWQKQHLSQAWRGGTLLQEWESRDFRITVISVRVPDCQCATQPTKQVWEKKIRNGRHLELSMARRRPLRWCQPWCHCWRWHKSLQGKSAPQLSRHSKERKHPGGALLWWILKSVAEGRDWCGLKRRRGRGVGVTYGWGGGSGGGRTRRGGDGDGGRRRGDGGRRGRRRGGGERPFPLGLAVPVLLLPSSSLNAGRWWWSGGWCCEAIKKEGCEPGGLIGPAR